MMRWIFTIMPSRWPEAKLNQPTAMRLRTFEVDPAINRALAALGGNGRTGISFATGDEATAVAATMMLTGLIQESKVLRFRCRILDGRRTVNTIVTQFNWLDRAPRIKDGNEYAIVQKELWELFRINGTMVP
jgi:hypothetical protein